MGVVASHDGMLRVRKLQLSMLPEAFLSNLHRASNNGKVARRSRVQMRAACRG